MSAKKLKDNQELKKSMISTENQSCQFEEVQTNMSLDYQVSGGGTTFAEGNQLRQVPPSSYPAGAVRHQVAKQSVTPSSLMAGRQPSRGHAIKTRNNMMQASKTVGGQHQKGRRAEDQQYRVNTNYDGHGTYDVALDKGETSGLVQLPAYTPNR
jgi:hypothetical protein